MQPLHSIAQYRSRHSYIQTHESLTSGVECLSVIQGQPGFVHEKIHKIVMSKSKGTTAPVPLRSMILSKSYCISIRILRTRIYEILRKNGTQNFDNFT